ncbi:hypothetical protein VTN96DRAFT_6968 [Rasamsonia emersonii]|uniref:ER-bound oxygenase mpaB/mpaB'/Rubber oxygenase catalytic domain-containing protein n=1 Tax=Rasamsonia emersonii (strain ATCC 16479 / CBS 393.64 / IMI 116815) TaxID=1408163 RepID=A0A0F4Z2N9_RASE3|nr:hypothetical protein T310_1641 [Rasamsonia emersonii CBS 393.64]KKA24356.1 hypothetical protein T310_1641 [Rasamsonia emersonii CBS 393.64]
MASQNGQVADLKFAEREETVSHDENIQDKPDNKDIEKADLTIDTDAPSDTEILDALEKFTTLPKILREGILLTGGGVAILLQAAKAGMAGSSGSQQSENLAEKLFEGLRTTVIYMYGLTFGTREERKKILERINNSSSSSSNRQGAGQGKGHDYLRDYYPEDPQLRLWIAATLYATGTDFFQRVFEKVDFHRAQRVYREFTVLTVALRLPRGVWPENRNAFWAYWDEEVEKLNVDPHARPVVHDLKAYADVPRWVKLVRRPFIRVVTPEMLPRHVREQYGLRSTATSRFLYRVAIGGAKAIYPTLPKKIRTHPLNRALRQLRGEISSGAL